MRVRVLVDPDGRSECVDVEMEPLVQEDINTCVRELLTAARFVNPDRTRRVAELPEHRVSGMTIRQQGGTGE